MFGVETAALTVAATNAGKWYRGVLEAIERFMVKLNTYEADFSRKRHASAVGGAQRNTWEGRGQQS